MAELHEITRLPGNLRKSLNRISKPFSMSEIPEKYTLGTGHVKFFYCRMKYLQKRFENLVEEMIRRGYNPTYRDSSIFQAEERFYNDWTPDEEAIEKNRSRIKERLT